MGGALHATAYRLSLLELHNLLRSKFDKLLLIEMLEQMLLVAG